MYRSVKEIMGYQVLSNDGAVGEVDSLLFVDVDWRIRYLVVITGNWLLQRQVLISPFSLNKPDWMGNVLRVELTRQQVKDSPEIRLDKPVSFQQVIGLHRHFDWPAYWEEEKDIGQENQHLRSTRAVQGFRVEASDGEIGRVDDYLFDDQAWLIRYLVIDTGEGIGGKKVLLPVSRVEAVDWNEQAVFTEELRETILDAPEYRSASEVDRPFEERLLNYYENRKQKT